MLKLRRGDRLPSQVRAQGENRLYSEKWARGISGLQRAKEVLSGKGGLRKTTNLHKSGILFKAGVGRGWEVVGENWCADMADTVSGIMFCSVMSLENFVGPEEAAPFL